MTLSDRRLHLLGIGGAGMSALAVVAYAWGADVSGCDRVDSEYSQRLRRFGIEVAEGHDRAHLEPGMEVVVSSAVPDELDELAAASELGLRVIGRGRAPGRAGRRSGARSASAARTARRPPPR